MREALAWIFGFVTTAVTLRVLEYGGRLVGVHRKIDLPYPVEYSFGRYIDEIIDEDFTAFGIASLAFSIMVGVFVGAAVYRKTLIPARSAQEQLTAKVWFVALTAILILTALGQVIFGTHTTGVFTLLKDLVEYGGAFYIGWVSWKWWKRKVNALAGDVQ